MGKEAARSLLTGGAGDGGAGVGDLSGLLADRLRRATGDAGSITQPYLRLKPGTSLVLAATWQVPGHGDVGVVARVYAPHALPKLDKTVRKADPADVLCVDRDAGLVVTTWRAERDLPGVRALVDDGRRAAFAATLPPALRGAFAEAPQLLRHNPERRAVLRAVGPDGGALLVRAVRPDDVAAVVGGYAALAAGPVPSPAVLAVDAARGLVVTEWLPGTPVDTLLTGSPESGAGRDELLRDVGAMAAALHAAPVDGDGARAPRTSARAAADALVAALPYLADDAHRLADRLDHKAAIGAAEAAAANGGSDGPAAWGVSGGASGPGAVLVHGDLSLDQVILAADGTLGLVDADSAGPGDAADDLGSLVAALVRADADAAPRAAAAVLAGYRAAGGSAPDQALRHATATHLLRRAVEPFRRLEDGWEDACAALVTAAHDVLDDPVVRAPRSAHRPVADGSELHPAADGSDRLHSDGETEGDQNRRRGGGGARGGSGERSGRSWHGVRYAPVAVEIAARLAADGRALRAALPRSADHLLLTGTEPAGTGERVLAGQWFADGDRAARVAHGLTADGRTTEATLLATPRDAVVLHHDGADLRLPCLAPTANRPGARLVAHRPGRRGVVQDAAGTFTKVVRRGATIAEPDVAAAAFRTPAVVARSEGVTTTTVLPGHTLHALLGDASVPDDVLVRAGRAVGRSLRRLQDGVPHDAGAPPQHDVAAEVAVVERWWTWATEHEAASPATAQAVLARVTAALVRSADDGLTAVPTHRDLHDKQLLIDTAEPDRVGLLDLDLATTAHPALDLANLLVHLELRAHQGVCPPVRARAVADAVLDGYAPGDAVLAALPGWTTAARARLVAVYAFRPAPGDVPGALLDAVLDGPAHTHLEER